MTCVAFSNKFAKTKQKFAENSEFCEIPSKNYPRLKTQKSSTSERNCFFRRDALKEQFGKEPSTVRCLAVKSALLGTRHPRKEKEAALQNVTGEPACLCGMIAASKEVLSGGIIKTELYIIGAVSTALRQTLLNKHFITTDHAIIKNH